MKEYCLGFRFRRYRWFFEDDCIDVALIRKIKPAPQAGKLNGIGGGIEDYDLSPAHAQAREFKEETGVDTKPEEWRCFGKLIHNGTVIHLFASWGDCKLTQTTPEKPMWLPIETVHRHNSMRNLAFLVPLALDKDAPVAEIVDITIPA